jgi:N-acetyl-anhydromuramyl-L-alanine amidase AmpD
MGAVWEGAHPRNFRVGRPGAWQPKAIVIHVMDGSLAGTDAWFNDPASGVSAHYGIGRDGTIHQYVKETDTAFHAGTVDRPTWPDLKRDREGRPINPNFYTIGIEHAGWGERAEPWPPQQRDASLKLVREIAARWEIPLDGRHVIPHAQIRASKPHCPGRGLGFAAYLADLGTGSAAAATPPAARAFTDSVRAVATVNVRRLPSTAGLPRRKLLAGDEFKPVEVVTGELHRGISSWYRNQDSEYVWAGGTDRPSTAID